MPRHGSVAFGLCLIPLLGCARSPAPPDAAADVQAVNQVREREIAAFSAGQPDTLASLFASDAVIMPPNEPVLNGSAALRTWAQAIADQATVRGQYTSSEVAVVGDWAIDRYTGLLTITQKASGAATEERVKGIHIYRPAGWLVAHRPGCMEYRQPTTGYTLAKVQTPTTCERSGR